MYSVRAWAHPHLPPRQGHELVLELICKPDQCEVLKQATKTAFWQEELGNAYRRQLNPAEIVTHANAE